MGGGEVILAHIARLAKTMARVDLALVFGVTEPIAAELRECFDHVNSFDFDMKLQVRTLPSLVRNLRALRKLLSSGATCGCIAMGYASAVRAALATTGTNVTLLWMCNFPMGVSSRSRRLKRSAGVRLLSQSGAIAVCPSTAIRDELEALGYARRQLRVVHNGVDIERICRCSMSNDERQRFRLQHQVPSADLVATCVARVDPVKNHQLLIRAVAHAARQGIRVALICAGGSDPGHRTYAEGLRRLADELGVADRILWLGHSDEVSQWLAASDVAVLASWMEAGPLSLIEAAAAGLPLVAPRVGGVDEVVIPGRTGYLFSLDDAEECAHALVRLAGNEAERRALGTQARRLVELEFSEKSMDAKWSALIGGLVDSSRYSRPMAAR